MTTDLAASLPPLEASGGVLPEFAASKMSAEQILASLELLDESDKKGASAAFFYHQHPLPTSTLPPTHHMTIGFLGTCYSSLIPQIHFLETR